MEDSPVEIWYGDKKITIYDDEVIRVWGSNMETEMFSEPRSHDTVDSAFKWLIGKSKGIDEPMRDALATLLFRYEGMIKRKGTQNSREGELSLEYANNMIATVLDNLESWPEDKLNRWLGFIQCIMILHGLTNTQAERDFSRPLFHKVYKERRQKIPEIKNEN